MRVIMSQQILGGRVDADGNRSEWPGRGEPVDLPDAEAVAMLRTGAATPESGSVEDAILSAKIQDLSGIPVSLDSVPGPIDETAPEGIRVPKPNGELREISSTKRLEPGDHNRTDLTVVDETSGPVIYPDQSAPSGPDATANESSGLKPRRAGAATKTGAGEVPVAKPGRGNAVVPKSGAEK
jgi:hypothetical protein